MLTPETLFLNQVNAELRTHNNILLVSPDTQKLRLGKYVCDELKTKSLLVLNLETYKLLVEMDNPVRFTRYMQWYEAISSSAVKYLCNNRAR